MDKKTEELMKEYGVNQEQCGAIDISKNIALHAGAGSGKTRVLTRRFVRLLKEDRDCNVDSIVTITFTEKAALEMKERIRAIVEDTIRKAAPEERLRWKKVKDDLSSASISTLHSFCDSIIRENYYLLGIEPDYDIIENVDRKVILNRLSDDTINQVLQENTKTGLSQSLLRLYGTSCITGGSLSSIIQAICSKIKEGAFSFEDVRKATEGNLTPFKEDMEPEALKDIEVSQMLVLSMAEKLEEGYSEYKRREGLLDFNDLELFALKILENPKAREKYRERYKYFLVDEFQDTNELQRRILYCLVQENGNISAKRLFIVGDHKQAIYGFRGTDYRIFTRVSEDINANGETRELSTCYRSYPNVVNTVNALFEQLLDPYESLKISDEKMGKDGLKAELIIITPEKEKDISGDTWKKNKGLLKNGTDEKDIKDFLKTINTEALPDNKADVMGDVLSARINKLKGEGFEYRDIAVLLRTRSKLSSYENALKRSRIPYCVMGGIGFFDKQEVADILNTYEMIFSPGSLIAVAAALRSPIFGVPDDCLLKVFKGYKETGDLIAALKKASKDEACMHEKVHDESRYDGACTLEKDSEESSEEREHTLEKSSWDRAYALERAARIIDRLTEVCGLYSAGDFLRLLIKELSYKEILLTQSQGFQKYRNVEKLMRIADEFDDKDMYHAREFIEYVQVLRQEDTQSGDALLDTEDSDAVKILTIHASKGLEFRAVIIPGMEGSLTSNSMKMMETIVFDPECGVVAGFKGDGENPLYTTLQAQYKSKLIDEGKRLLYVAATRAIEYLGFIGYDCKTDKLEEDKLDSFIKQVRYAQLQCPSIESMDEVDGNSLLEEYGGASEEPEKEEEEEKDETDILKRVLYTCPSEPSDQASISRYMTFNKCKRLYYFTCKAGLGSMDFTDLPEDEDSLREEQAINRESIDEENRSRLKASYRGTVTHSILEAIVKRNADRKDAEGIIDEIVSSFEPYNREVRQQLKYSAVRYVDNFYKAEDKLSKEIYGRIVKRETELEFRMPLMENSSIGVNGIIDRIDLHEGEDGLDGYIIDYKTNRLDDKTPEQLAEYYKPQLMLYARAFNDLYYAEGRKPRLKGMYLYLLSTGDYVRVDYSEQDLESLLSKLKEVFEYTSLHNAMEDYPPEPSQECESCRIRGLCRE